MDLTKGHLPKERTPVTPTACRQRDMGKGRHALTLSGDPLQTARGVAREVWRRPRGSPPLTLPDCRDRRDPVHSHGDGLPGPQTMVAFPHPRLPAGSITQLLGEYLVAAEVN